jgi:hypothetical protein
MWSKVFKKSFHPSFNALLPWRLLSFWLVRHWLWLCRCIIGAGFARVTIPYVQERKALDVEWGQLLLEQNSWGGYARIEQLSQQQQMQAAPLQKW